MGLTLAPRRRVNLENRDPEEVVSRTPVDDTPPPSPPAAAARPRLKLGAANPNAAIPDEQAGVNPDEVQQHAAMQQTQEIPYSKRDLDVAELQDREANKPEDKNGRWKSFLLNGLEGMSTSARLAMATGRNPLAAGVGGFLGRGAAGAITPSLDEQTTNDERKDELRRQIGYDQEREANESDIDYKRAKPLLELKKITSDAATAASLEKGRNDRALMTEGGRATRSAADLAMKEKDLASREKDRAGDNERQAQAANKIPDTYYRGKDDGRVKDEALAEVLSKPEYHEKSVRPEVLKAFGSQEALIKAVRNNEINLSDVFTDPSKGAMFQRDLAATYTRKAGEAQEFDRALNMTSKSPAAVRVTYAGFESAWQKFATDLQAAAPKARRAIRDKFERYLAGVRVVGE